MVEACLTVDHDGSIQGSGDRTSGERWSPPHDGLPTG
jgi:hypothetical protein